jgi:hypothetical protein
MMTFILFFYDGDDDRFIYYTLELMNDIYINYQLNKISKNFGFICKLISLSIFFDVYK